GHFKIGGSARPAAFYPMTPLFSINRAEFTGFFVRPFIPDSHPVFLQPAHIRLTAQKPEQFVDYGFEVQLLRGEDGEILSQIKPRLRAEYGIRARACTVGLELAMFENVPQQIEVLNHKRAA